MLGDVEHEAGGATAGLIGGLRTDTCRAPRSASSDARTGRGLFVPRRHPGSPRPRTPANRAAIATTSTRRGRVLKSDNFLNAFPEFCTYIFKWVPETAALLNNPALNESGLERALYAASSRRCGWTLVRQIDHFDERVTRTLQALDGFDDARVRGFSGDAEAAVVAFEYVTARTAGLPDRSTLQIHPRGPVGTACRHDRQRRLDGRRQRVPESSVSITDGVRDFRPPHRSTSADERVEDAVVDRRHRYSVFGVAYLSEKHQRNAAVTFAGNTFTAEPGWLHLLQARLTIPVKGSGVKVRCRSRSPIARN